jgi:tripartite ATP-independent transporter DctM subunit
VATRLVTIGRRLEDSLAYLCILLLTLLLILEVIARKLFHTGIPHSTNYVQHLVLAATFIAASITSREKKHLSLAAAIKVRDPYKTIFGAVVAVLSASLAFAFSVCSLSFAMMAFAPGEKVGFLPKRVLALVIVIGFLLMGLRFIFQLERKKLRIPVAAVSALLGVFFGFSPLAQVLGQVNASWAPFLTSTAGSLQPLVASLTAPLIILLVLTAFLGVPIFIVLGGIGYLLFSRLGMPLEIIPNQAYTVLIGHSIPAIPLFAIVGFLLSESKAGERLVKFFQAVFSWFPGGLTVMAVLVCAFFTTFTGASGVTILALGGLLSFILMDAGYSKRFSVGILTASGSVGLLFPPSLPVIIYGVTAQTSIKDMFVGGLIPGMVLALALAAAGIILSVKRKIPRHPLQVKQAVSSLGKSIWELLLPLVILVFYFGGITNLQESAAVAVLYVFVVETFVKKDLRIRDFPKVLAKCIPVIGGVLIILALANGLSYYIIDAQIPTKLATWVQSAIASKYVFLLLLNLALLVVGCFMDIYSAILVVVPLIIPLGNLYGIHPVHLGIIFLANLELGYLTPPVGLNLFLASYRFNEPMPKVYRDVLVFLAIMLGAVLLITYVPLLTTALLR